MAKRLIVHVGPRKTGSTSIQQMLFTCRDKLRAGGIHVPRAGLTSAPSRRCLSHSGLIYHGQPKSNWTKLAEEIASTDAETFVVSAEDLTSPSRRVACAERLEKLVERTSVEVDVVGFARPQWQLLESEYSQRVFDRRTKARFSQFVREMLDAGESTILDYRLVFAPYRTRFGDRVRVFPLQASHLPRGLVAHFLSLVGAESVVMEEASAQSRTNERRGAKAVEVCRLVGTRLGGRPRRPELRHLLPELPTLFNGDAPFAGFSWDEIRQIEDRFALANAAFAHETGIKPDGTLFQEAAASDAVRPNLARWEDFDSDERHRVRRYVLKRTGVDIERKHARKWRIFWARARRGEFAKSGAKAIRRYFRAVRKRMTLRHRP